MGPLHHQIDVETSNTRQTRTFEKAFDMVDTDLKLQSERVNAISNSTRTVFDDPVPQQSEIYPQFPETLHQGTSTQRHALSGDGKPTLEEYSHLADPYLFSPQANISPELSVNEAEHAEHKPAQDDADALAETATQLLENVKDERSTKFQQSNFLSLMRQLRNREVHVEGDKIVDVSLVC